MKVRDGLRTKVDPGTWIPTLERQKGVGECQ
jgi:hypothetical protein